MKYFMSRNTVNESLNSRSKITKGKNFFKLYICMIYLFMDLEVG